MQVAEWQGEPTRLGSYEIVRKLARGGMADLYLAKTVTNSFERLVVLKQILPKYADNPRYVQLFFDEARLAASLGHGNIVQVFDIGNDAGNYFFAMEYLHGQDVRTILHRAWQTGEKVPFAYGVQIATQIASALHHAHERRRADGTLLELVHRDVSPSNVVVTYDGAVKLLDFGVAKASTSTIKTRTGTLKGKIAYMSPEQAKGAPLDRRSDIFSLGIVLWEMVTTRRLFKGDNDLATLQLIINEPPRRPSSVNPDVPAELDRIILRALSQDLAGRYQTAQELALELEQLARDLQLVQSASALSVYMRQLFKEEIVSWETARAQGVELSEHLTSVGDMTTPVSESEFMEQHSFARLVEEEEAELEDEDELDPVAGMIETAPRLDPSRAPHAAMPPLAFTPLATPAASFARQSWPLAMRTIAPRGEVFTPEQAARWYRNAGYLGAGLLLVIVVISIALGGR